MRWIWIAALACVAPVTTMAQTPLHDLQPERGQWASKPSGDDMARLYPDGAKRTNTSGWADIICRTTETGTLERCQVLAEAPANASFGAAAIKLSAKFKLDPKKMPPGALTGGVITVPIVWLTPDGASTPLHDSAVGGGAILLTALPAGTAGTAKGVACGTQAAPAQKCAAHAIAWDKHPENTDAAVLSTTATPEATAMLCAVRKDLQLDDCEVLGAASPSQVAAMDQLIAGFVAKSEAGDKTPVAGGRVFMPFNWRLLKQVAEAKAAFKAVP